MKLSTASSRLLRSPDRSSRRLCRLAGCLGVLLRRPLSGPPYRSTFMSQRRQARWGLFQISLARRPVGHRRARRTGSSAGTSRCPSSRSARGGCSSRPCSWSAVRRCCGRPRRSATAPGAPAARAASVGAGDRDVPGVLLRLGRRGRRHRVDGGQPRARPGAPHGGRRASDTRVAVRAAPGCWSWPRRWADCCSSARRPAPARPVPPDYSGVLLAHRLRHGVRRRDRARAPACPGGRPPRADHDHHDVGALAWRRSGWSRRSARTGW